MRQASLSPRITRSAPLALKRRVGTALDWVASEYELRRATAATARMPDDALISGGPIVVAGFLDKTHGIGRSARSTLAKLKQSGADAHGFDIGTLFSPFKWRPQVPDALAQCATILLVCNPPEARAFFGRLGRRAWAGKRRIGYWVWELPQAPADWIRISRWFDEVWAPSPFVASALSAARCPVRYVPYSVEAPGMTAPDRARFGMPQDAVVFLTMADVNSSFTRKNPLGALAAYEAAFPQPNGRTCLVVKLQAPPDSSRLAAFREAAARRADVRLLTEILSDGDLERLIASADAVVSLHRAEGFGLPLAEAMAMGRAVLATGWSGNMAFMSDMSGALVDFRLSEIADADGIYSKFKQQWAEPDIAHAARLMRDLAASAQLRADLSARGRASVAALSHDWMARAFGHKFGN